MKKENFYKRIELLHNEIVLEIKQLMAMHRVTEVDLLGSSCDHAYVTGYPGDGADVMEMEGSKVYAVNGAFGNLMLDVILDVDTDELAASNDNGDIGDAYQCWKANDFTHFMPCAGIDMVYESVYQVLEQNKR